jgi:3-oxoacyl-[acyl-carrier-protein] synthase-3
MAYYAELTYSEMAYSVKLDTSIRIVGTGSFVPEYAVSTDVIAKLIERYVPARGAAWARQKLGISERRFALPLDPATGYPIGESDELALAERAATAALDRAGIKGGDLDGLWYVSCTQSPHQQHFSRLALGLHARLGLRPTAFALEMDAGCGGAIYAITTAMAQMRGAELEYVLVIGANMPSQYFRYWETYARSGAWLSMYIFGDGAGAAILGQTHGGRGGIVATYTAADPRNALMQFSQLPTETLPLYRIDARAVAQSFGTYAREALYQIGLSFTFRLEDVRRFYFHQVNAILLRSFIAELAIPDECVAIHVDRYGNLASAATLVLLDEDIRTGTVGEGDLCMFCVVGAGAQYGAMLVQL